MTVEQVEASLAEVFRRMQEVSLLHKQQMAELTAAIKSIQEQCPHDGVPKCRACGKTTEAGHADV